MKARTVFVLGAGSSMSYGLPSGRKLFEEAKANSVEGLADTLFVERTEAQSFLDVLSGSLVESLDSVLETRADIAKVGKRFIANTIADYEGRAFASKFRNSNGTSDDDWIAELFQQLDTGRLDEFPTSSVSFITFNYDRILEFRLARGLVTRYGNLHSDSEIQAVARQLQILHLHGDIGAFKYMSDDAEELPFGYIRNRNLIVGGERRNALEISEKRIKVVHEADKGQEPFPRAHKLLNDAHRIIFLGFGYGRDNLSRLLSSEWVGKLVCGTSTLNPSQFEYQVRRPLEVVGVTLADIGKTCRDALSNHLNLLRDEVP